MMRPLRLLCLLSLVLACHFPLSGCAGGSHASEPLLEAKPQVAADSFYGPHNAWLVTREGNLWRTESGGSSWEEIQGVPAGGFYSLSFIDARRGWAVGARGIVWRTEDGGRKWAHIAELEDRERAGWSFVGSSQTHFTDERHGWVVEPFGVWRTLDGGLNWRRVFARLDYKVKGQPVNGVFMDPGTAIISGTEGELYLTADGGETWQVKTFTDVLTFRHVSFSDRRKGWLVGSMHHGAVLLQTENGGQDWRRVNTLPTGASIYSVHYIDDKEGWAVGMASADYSDKRLVRRGLVLHTSDAGETWRQVEVGANEAFFDRVSFLNRQQGWLVSRDKVYRTDDAGSTWRPVLTFRQQPK